MSDNFVVFLTAENCGHCKHTRGKGFLNDGKVLNGVDFLEKIFKYNLEIVNIHYQNMMGKKNNIIEVTKFYKKDKDIFQERYTKKDNFLSLEVYKNNNNKAKKIFSNFVLEKNLKIKWSKFLNDRIPDRLMYYIFYFPCFLVINRKNWQESILNDKIDLVAIPNAGITYRDEKGNIGLEKTSNSINARNVDIIKLVEDIEKGKVKLEPMKDLKKEKTVKAPKTERQVEMPMENFIEYKDVIIKSA